MSADRVAARRAYRRAAQGYLTPSQRPGCNDCRHCGPQSYTFNDGRSARHCALGGFFVSPGGICKHHQPERKPK
jgi:hypothetical protein